MLYIAYIRIKVFTLTHATFFPSIFSIQTEEKKSIMERYHAIQEVCLQVQQGLDTVASLGERVKKYVILSLCFQVSMSLHASTCLYLCMSLCSLYMSLCIYPCIYLSISISISIYIYSLKNFFLVFVIVFIANYIFTISNS